MTLQQHTSEEKVRKDPEETEEEEDEHGQEDEKREEEEEREDDDEGEEEKEEEAQEGEDEEEEEGADVLITRPSWFPCLLRMTSSPSERFPEAPSFSFSFCACTIADISWSSSCCSRSRFCCCAWLSCSARAEENNLEVEGRESV